ncbi:MAG: hypothetical protein JSS21_09390 [Proteobacteria bacterium]|nr:hypothetical protein [Pseudomonadota bacterium]
MFPAAFVIGLGVLFLLRNLGIAIPFLDTPNWWAWIVLIAAIAPLARALDLWRRSGRIDGAVVHHLFVGSAIIAVAVLFLLDLSWQTWWPAFMILGGLAMLGGGKRCGASSDQAPH